MNASAPAPTLALALALALAPDPAPNLLMLDESTNNLMASARQLEQALHAFRGALIIVGHGISFLGDAGMGRRMEMDSGTVR